MNFERWREGEVEEGKEGLENFMKDFEPVRRGRRGWREV